MLSSQRIYAEQFRFINFEIEDGLSSNTVRSILQDSHGFMWFGTENGLNRFDGYTFKTYFNNPNDSTSLGNNYVYALFEDKKGILWIGTDDGVYLYNPMKEEFSFFAVQTEMGITIQSHIYTIKEDKNGNLWFATHGQGIFIYNPNNGQLTQYVSEGKENTLDSNRVTTLLIDGKGNIWASTSLKSDHIYLFDTQKNQFTRFTLQTDTQFSVHIIKEDHYGNLWLGTWENGIYKVDKRSGKVETYLHPTSSHGVRHIHEVTEYEPGILLIGSDDGLTYFNTHTNEIIQMTATEFNDGSLSNKFIYPVFRDKEGGLWVGTYYGGVNYCAPHKDNIEGYAHSKYKNSVNGNIISKFCEDTDGNIWIGTDDGGLSHFNVGTKTFTNYMPEPGKNSLSYHNIHALFLDNNKLWIGTYTGGLNVLDLKTGQFKLYETDPNDEHSLDRSNSIYSIFKDKEGNLWLGSMNMILRYNKETDNFSRIRNTEITTIDIIQDKEGCLWFGTWGKGIFRYNPQTDEWKQLVHNTKDKNTIPNNQINCFCLDDNDRLWIGTDDGLCYYSFSDSTFTRVSLSIPNITIRNIIKERNTLWIATANGLVTYNPDSGDTHTLLKKDGLQSNQFNIKAGLLSSSGYLYLGTTNGFNIIDPRFVFENKYIPPVVITNLQIFNQNVTISEDGILNKSIVYADEIGLNYKQNVFSIEYAALSYSVPSKNMYKYKLEGFDKDWNIVGNQRKATYTNLPAGKYVFRVIASNNDGGWNDQGASLAITIHPPFWKTRLAYALYVLFLLGAIGTLYYIMRKRTEQRHNQRLQELRVENEKELHDAKINFFTLIAHEIRTPVSLIIGPLEKIMDSAYTFPQVIEDDLKIINRNSQRLLALVNQLLDFRKAEKGIFIINFSEQNIYELLQNIYDRFKPVAEQKGITFTLDTDNKELFAVIDTEAITKVISNLLTNALKYARNKIKIKCTSNNGYVIIKVTDNGRGIEENEQKSIFRPFYQIAQSHKPGTGLGLSLVKSLVDAHKGMVEVDSIPGQFTTFTITIPKEQQDFTPASVKNENIADLPVSEPDNDDTSLAKPTLLIVDDNADVRDFLSDSFKATYSILLAKNGKEGLELLKQEAADLIISDVMMPVMDGIEFCKELKENVLYSHIPFILLTAKTDNDSKVTGIKIGADAYIEKPFSLQVLRAQIENLLESRKKLRKKFSEMPFVPLGSVAVNKADEQFLNRLNEIIEKNISNMDFSIDLMAEQLCISRSGLFSKIKTLVEMTPNELIQLVRLKKAAELLSTRKYRINEICYQVGFNNPSYFSRCFQKQFGVLPKDFINKNN